MRETILFQDLPSTFPVGDRFKRHAALGSVVVHAFMLVAAVVSPMLFIADMPHLTLLTYVAPMPPPGPALVQNVAQTGSSQKQGPIPVVSTSDGDLIAPIAVPKEIVLVVDTPAPSGDAGFGVVGGMPWGANSDFFRELLTPAAAPPPPPPPKPASLPLAASASVAAQPEVEQPKKMPVRVGEYFPVRLIQSAPPAYPAAAKAARVQGTVLLEVRLSESGQIEEICIVSGPPLLAEAAVAAVKNWIYAPPVLNGKNMEVIVSVRVNFNLEQS